MSSWSRKKDAWIAETCEGWTVRWIESEKRFEILDGNGHASIYPFYLTDPAAAIRAAEAWACKATEGTKRVIAIVTEFYAGEKLTVANLQQNDHHPYCGDEPGNSWVASDIHTSAALAQALYRATGGPA